MDFLIFRDFLRESYQLDKSSFKILMNLISAGHRYKTSRGIIKAKNIEELAKKCDTTKDTLRKSLSLMDFESFISVDLKKNDKIVVKLNFPRPTDANHKKNGGYIKIPTAILEKELSSNAIKFFIYALDSSNGHYNKKTCIYNIYAQKTLNLSKNTVTSVKNELSNSALISISMSENKQLIELKKPITKKLKIAPQKLKIAPKKLKIGINIKKPSSSALFEEIRKGDDFHKKQIEDILKTSGKYRSLSDFEIENLIAVAKEEVGKRGVITKSPYTVVKCLNVMAYLASNDPQYGTATIIKILERADFYTKNPKKEKMGEVEKIQADFIKNGGEFSEFERLRVYLKDLYPNNGDERFINKLKNAANDPDKKLLKSISNETLCPEEPKPKAENKPTPTTKIEAKVIKPNILLDTPKKSQSEFFKDSIGELLKNWSEKNQFNFLN